MQPDPPATHTHTHNSVPAQLFYWDEKSVVATLLCCQQAPPLNKTALKYLKHPFEVFIGVWCSIRHHKSLDKAYW